MRKRCSKCLIIKAKSEFSLDNRASSGLQSSCKLCQKTIAFKLREVDELGLRRARRIISDKYTQKHKTKIMLYKTKWTIKNPFRWKATNKLNYSIRIGQVCKRNCCEICLDNENIRGHHSDYSKPLDAIWLCQRCHGLLHNKFKLLKIVYEEKSNK